MWSSLRLFSVLSIFCAFSVGAPQAPAAPTPPAPPAAKPPGPPDAAAWKFILQNQTSGVIALEAIVVSPTLVLFLDVANNDPLQINNHSAWGALWDLQTSTVKALDVKTDSFCASGALLSNGSMVSVGGNPGTSNPNNPAGNGLNSLRIFEPCASPDGTGCTLFDDPSQLALAEARWYPSSVRLSTGDLLIVGGTHTPAAFYNIDPANTVEFFPKRDGGVPRPLAFLERSLPANLFPRIFALPDGTVFMVAGNQSIIYNVDTRVETILPDIPNNRVVTNPLDGGAILLPLSPPLYIPEILLCGGSTTDPRIQPINLSSQDPASKECSRLELTPAGIKRGWQVEHMLEGRTINELVHLPNGQVLIINGAQTGYAALNGVKDPVGSSNADNAALIPSLYTPDAPLGKRISNAGLPTATIPRVYHSSVNLTPQGNFLLAGSNPNSGIVTGVKFSSELRVETLNPPYMFVARPAILSMPAKLPFGRTFTMPISIPANLKANKIQLSLMDLGFSSHAFHSSARLVFMTAVVSKNRKSLTFTTPPTAGVFPPGPAFVFLTIDDVTSTGSHVMVGSGAPPGTRQ